MASEAILRNKKKVICLMAFISVAIVLFLTCYEVREIRDTRVKASGTVEVQEIQISPLASGRITEIFFSESDVIKKGDVLLKLSLDGADHDVAMAEAALEAARQKHSELVKGFRHEDIAAAEADYKLREVQYLQAQKDNERFSKLAEEGVISLREAELYRERADAQRHAKDISAETLSKLKRGFRPEDIKQAEALVAKAEAALAKARVALSYKTVTSPADGVILSKNYELGDVIGAGAAVATLGNMKDMWIKLYIPSTQLGRVKLGGEATVKVDSHPGELFKAKVTEVNQKAEYNPRLSLTQSERANMVFWIKVSVEDERGILKPGMPADVVLQ